MALHHLQMNTKYRKGERESHRVQQRATRLSNKPRPIDDSEVSSDCAEEDEEEEEVEVESIDDNNIGD